MTFYASRDVVNNVKPRNLKNSRVNESTKKLLSQGYIILTRNNNYSNTMMPCKYICKLDHVKNKWM